MKHQLWNQDNTKCRLVLIIIFFLISMLIVTLALNWITTPSVPSNASQQGSRAVHTLKFVIVVSRHGNRPPLAHIPNDPYPINNTQYWPYGEGGITPVGRVQMFNLGAKIRSLYDGFLNKRYESNDFYASSTAIDRSMISGGAFLAGLFPPIEKQPWENKFPSQLIPLYSNSRDKTLVVEFCKKVLLIRNVTVAQFGAENNAVISGLNYYLSEHSGLNVTGIEGFFPFWDSIICETTEGFKLPTWIEQIFPHPILDLAGKYYMKMVAETNELINIVMGDFYRVLLGIMKSKVEGTLSPDRKMYFYSGHDFTLITLQAILGIPKPIIVDVARPGSAMIFELHQQPDTGEFTIQVLYIDGSSDDLAPQHLPIPNCNPSCMFQQIVKTTQTYANSKSFEEECEMIYDDKHSN